MLLILSLDDSCPETLLEGAVMSWKCRGRAKKNVEYAYPNTIIYLQYRLRKLLSLDLLRLVFCYWSSIST